MADAKSTWSKGYWIKVNKDFHNSDFLLSALEVPISEHKIYGLFSPAIIKSKLGKSIAAKELKRILIVSKLWFVDNLLKHDFEGSIITVTE